MRRGPEGEATTADGAAAPPRLPLWSRPGFLIRRLHQIHSSLFFEECKRFNITPVQYGVLTALHHRPGSDQVTLGAELGIDRTNVADVLERLARRGMIRRARSERDRRSMVAFVTRKGESAMNEMYAHMQRSQERLMAPLAPEFRPAFMAMIIQIIEGNNHHGRTELRTDFEVEAKLDRKPAKHGRPGRRPGPRPAKAKSAG